MESGGKWLRIIFYIFGGKWTAKDNGISFFGLKWIRSNRFSRKNSADKHNKPIYPLKEEFID